MVEFVHRAVTASERDKTTYAPMDQPQLEKYLTMRERTPQTDAEGVRFGRIMIDWHDGTQTATELVPADFARKLEAERDLLRERERELVAAIEAALAYCESEAIGTVQQEIADNERMRQTLRNALEYGR
jgi:CHASE3 domain sensor protein